MSVFAVIDAHSDDVHVSDIAATGEHQLIATLGRATTRRDATQLLHVHGWTPAGKWRTSTEGESVRAVTR